MRNFIILILMPFLLLGMSHAASFVEDEEFVEFTFGTVARISKDQLSILEYNFDQERNVEVDYTITDETEFVNVKRLAALRTGDKIELDFVFRGEERVVVTLLKEEEVVEIEIDERLLEEMKEHADGLLNG